jgi:hypothetical protein
MRKTSLESYRTIRESGVLSQRRFQVYEILYENGPMTGSEAALRFKSLYGLRTPNQANIVTRLGELRDMGIAEEVRTRTCSVTGMNVIEWDVTSNLPVSMKRKVKRRRIFIELDLFDTVVRTSWEPFEGGIEFRERAK